MKRRINLILILFLIGIPAVVKAQCCSGGVPMSNNVGLPAASKGTWQFALNYDLNVLKTYKTGTLELDRLRKRTTHSVLLQAGYSITNLISVEAFFSWVRQERIIFSSNDFQFTQGIGDAIVLLKLKPTPLSTNTIIQVGAGPKIPLGSAEEVNNNGFIESADLQPGSGSWDFIAWGSLSHQPAFRRSLNVFVSATSRFTGKNPDYLGSSVYKFGNEFQVIAGVSDRVAIKTLVVDPSISFRYRTQKQDEFNGSAAPNTGGDFLYVIPGISVAISNSLSYSIQVELPLYSKPEMTQVVPTYRLNTGFSYSLRPKQNPDYDF